MYALKFGGDMLNKREYEVMNAIYSLTHEKGICLISPAELISLLPSYKKYSDDQVENILHELALDNYFELLSSERKGEKMYVISLRANGFAFKRCFAQMKRDAMAKMFWAVASAVLAFLVGVVLKRIF
jgi:hypothetical protein